MTHAPISTLGKPTSCPGVGGKIRMTADLRDRHGQYPGFVALVERDDPPLAGRGWSTHVVYYADDVQKWESCWGHYDMTRAEAYDDFQNRVRQ